MLVGHRTTRLSRLQGSLSLLTSRRFGTFWFATLLSNFGFWAQQVAEPWLLLDLGASPFVVGLDAFMLDAPQWVFTLVGGVLADDADRRRVIAVFQSIQMLCPLALVVLTATGWVAPGMVVALALVVGVTDALSMPSYQSIVPTIVPPDQISTGLALNSIQFNLSRILGPALAGILLATVGVVGCFAVNAASYIPFVAVAVWILPATRGAGRAFDRRHPFAGMREVLRDRRIRGALAGVLVNGMFAAPVVAFASVLVRQSFGANAGLFSATLVGFGVGGLAGAAMLLVFDPAGDNQRTGSHFAIAFGVFVIAAALAPRGWLLPPIALGAGCAMTASNTLANTVVQATIGARGRGQAASVYMLALRGGAAIGSLATGVLVHVVGVRSALAIDGALAVIVHVALSQIRWFGSVRDRDGV